MGKEQDSWLEVIGVTIAEGYEQVTEPEDITDPIRGAGKLLAGELGVIAAVAALSPSLTGVVATAGPLAGAVSLGVGLGVVAGEKLWELDKKYISGGTHYEEAAEYIPPVVAGGGGMGGQDPGGTGAEGSDPGAPLPPTVDPSANDPSANHCIEPTE